MVLHHPHQELCAYIEAVKEVILRLLVLHEQLKILKHLQEKKNQEGQTHRPHSTGQD